MKLARPTSSSLKYQTERVFASEAQLWQILLAMLSMRRGLLAADNRSIRISRRTHLNSRWNLAGCLAMILSVTVFAGASTPEVRRSLKIENWFLQTSAK